MTWAQTEAELESLTEETEEIASEKGKKEKSPKTKARPYINPRAAKPFKSWGLHLKPGLVNTYTDINSADFFAGSDPKNEFSFGGAVGITKMFNPALGLQANFLYCRVIGGFDVATSTREAKDDFVNQTGIVDAI